MKTVWACLLAATALCAGEWGQFRGPSASGVGDDAKPPVRFNAATNSNVLWKAEIPGLAVSSPVVWGNRVFVTTAVSSDAKAKWRNCAAAKARL